MRAPASEKESAASENERPAFSGVFCWGVGGYWKNSQLWKSHRMQEGWTFGKKNVPRGTLMWNDNQQNLVSVENFFCMPAA
jgi:hypothetical protein